MKTPQEKAQSNWQAERIAVIEDIFILREELSRAADLLDLFTQRIDITPELSDQSKVRSASIRAVLRKRISISQA